MKRFKEYVHHKSSKEPILIPVEPVHGAHSKKHGKRKHVKEDSSDSPHETPHEAFDFNHRYNPNPHLGKTLHDVHKTLNKTAGQFEADHNKAAFHDYTDESYNINHHLLAKAKGEPGEFEPLHHDNEDDKHYKEEKLKTIHDMDSDFKHPNSLLKHDVTVFHGTNKFNPGKLAAQHPEGHIRSASYMSTSIEPSIAHDFAGSRGGLGHILRIHMKKNKDRGVYLGDNSMVKYEKEMVLPRDTVLKVHHTPTKLSNGTHVWDAHVVSHGPSEDSE